MPVCITKLLTREQILAGVPRWLKAMQEGAARAPRCGAPTASGNPCKRLRMKGGQHCTMHLHGKERLCEREHDLRSWWSQNAEPHASRLKEHELEAFYAACRAHIVTRTLDHAAWRELCVAFRAATTPPTEPDPNYWKHHGRAPHSALPDGW